MQPLSEPISKPARVKDGVYWWSELLNTAQQEELLQILRELVVAAPLYTPCMPRTGKPMSVRMTNCGPLGWVTDKELGYRYQNTHPETGMAWPPIPSQLIDIWRSLTGMTYEPEACLINFYDAQAKMGLHLDRDEDYLDAPVLSLSLGDTGVFRIGETRRGGKTQSIKLASGDAILLSGAGRLCFHGVDRIQNGSSKLLPKTGRINLTLRRVTNPG